MERELEDTWGVIVQNKDVRGQISDLDGHEGFIFYMTWRKSPMARHGRTLAK
jgi:hypothetical protein